MVSELKGTRIYEVINRALKTTTMNFDATAQVISRIYYLQIDYTFDKQKQGESSKFLGDIMSEVSSALYQDFTERLADLNTIELAIVREIFKEYQVLVHIRFAKDIAPYYPSHL